MGWTINDITDPVKRARVAKLVEQYINENRHQTSGSEPEQTLCHESMATAEGKKENPARFMVGITSFRRRLLDPDNLCPKYFLDGLRYAGIIPGDTVEHIELLLRQKKVCNKEDERTEIEIELIL